MTVDQDAVRHIAKVLNKKGLLHPAAVLTDGGVSVGRIADIR